MRVRVDRATPSSSRSDCANRARPARRRLPPPRATRAAVRWSRLTTGSASQRAFGPQLELRAGGRGHLQLRSEPRLRQATRGRVGSLIPRLREPVGNLPEHTVGRFEVPEQHLEPPEHGEARDLEELVGRLSCSAIALFRGRTSSLHETEISFDESFDPPCHASPRESPVFARTTLRPRWHAPTRRSIAPATTPPARCSRATGLVSVRRRRAVTSAWTSCRSAPAASRSPIRISLRARPTRGLPRYSNSSLRLRSISTPRSASPGVMSAAYISAWATRAIAHRDEWVRCGYVRRPVSAECASSSTRASMSPWKTWASLRWDRTRDYRASSPAASSSALIQEADECQAWRPSG